MRISELARRGGVPIATVKYYLRERLLPDGVLTAPNQARYDDTHLARLRLVRALLGPGGLSVARTRDVLAAIDRPPDGFYDLLGVAAAAVGADGHARADDHPHVHDLLRSWAWPVDEQDCGTHQALADALTALADAEFDLPEDILQVYARQLDTMADAEIAAVPSHSPGAALRYVVLGTVLLEPVLLAMRRLAQHAAAARRFGPGNFRG